jgi:hypothetical protein
VTLDATAAWYPDRADRFTARSASVRALAARIREQFPVSLRDA